MAENPRFNNKDMFTNIDSNDYSEVKPDNSSEVLATQGNVINSIRVFWNKLKEKLAFAITRPDYSKQVGGNYVPIFVDTDGVVQECKPTTIQAGIAQNGIVTIPINDIPNDNIYTGTTVCISVLNNSASGSTNDLRIQHNSFTSSVKYPSGVTVQAKDISKGDLLLATFCKNSINSSNNFWILLNKINTVVSTGQTTSNGSGNGGHPGLMTAEDKAKLDTIKWSANNYTLPTASSSTLGGVKSKFTGTIEGRDYDVEVKEDGTMKVNVPWTDTVYSLPTASSSTLGGVKLGAIKLANLNTPSSTSTTGRYYPIQTDKNDRLVVNVPWTNSHYTAELRAGNNNNSISNEATNNGNTYLKIVDGGSKTSSLKISGSKGTKVTSDGYGNITIESPTVTTYTKLDSSNFNPSIGYIIKGPSSNKANTNYYLAGNGTWVNGILVPVPPTNGNFTLKCNNGVLSWG